MKFKNFYMWRQKLPHWRAEDVTYYTTFRYKRTLNFEEMRELFRTLLALNAKKWQIISIGVFPEHSEMVVRTDLEIGKESSELTKILEPAKRKVSNRIIKKSGEKWSPFYQESYDRIIRDEDEYQSFCSQIHSMAIEVARNLETEDYEFFWQDNLQELPFPTRSQ